MSSRSSSALFLLRRCLLTHVPARNLMSMRPLNSIGDINRLTFSLRRYFSVTLPPKEPSQEQQEADDKRKVKRAYVLGGCLIAMWLSTHAILLYKRRGEYRLLNERLPPIEWDDFKDNYIAQGQVKTVVFQPHFGVANVYLHNPQEQQLKKQLVDWVHASPDKFTRPPDVRVIFEGSAKEAQAAVEAAVRAFPILHGKIIEFVIDEFPSYRELSFIFMATVFAVGAVTLFK